MVLVGKETSIYTSNISKGDNVVINKFSTNLFDKKFEPMVSTELTTKFTVRRMLAQHN